MADALRAVAEVGARLPRRPAAAPGRDLPRACARCQAQRLPGAHGTRHRRRSPERPAHPPRQRIPRRPADPPVRPPRTALAGTHRAGWRLPGSRRPRRAPPLRPRRRTAPSSNIGAARAGHRRRSRWRRGCATRAAPRCSSITARPRTALRRQPAGHGRAMAAPRTPCADPGTRRPHRACRLRRPRRGGAARPAPRCMARCRGPLPARLGLIEPRRHAGPRPAPAFGRADPFGGPAPGRARRHGPPVQGARLCDPGSPFRPDFEASMTSAEYLTDSPPRRRHRVAPRLLHPPRRRFRRPASRPELLALRPGRPGPVRENRPRAAAALGLPRPRSPVGLTQVHGIAVAEVDATGWPEGEGPRADALVTAAPASRSASSPPTAPPSCSPTPRPG